MGQAPIGSNLAFSDPFRFCVRPKKNLPMHTRAFLILISTFVIPPLATAATPAEVSAALTKAVSFHHSHAASHGGYVYRYSADFTLREAEGIPGPDTIWIQPPGTPAVGMAMLDAYEATKDKECLKAAVEAAVGVAGFW